MDKCTSNLNDEVQVTETNFESTKAKINERENKDKINASTLDLMTSNTDMNSAVNTFRN